MPIVPMDAKNIILQVLLLFNIQYKRFKMTQLPLKKKCIYALGAFFFH